MEWHSVDFVVIGGIAVVLYGGDSVTTDLDIAFDKSVENIRKLADALSELNARPKRWRTSSFRLQPSDLSANWLHLETDAGDVDLISRTPGIKYEDLRKECMKVTLEGYAIPVASLENLIKMKEATGRGKDEFHVAQLREILRYSKE